MPDEDSIDIPPIGFLSSAFWWRQVGLGLGLAFISAIGALIFVGLVALGTDLVWGDGATSIELFSGSIIILGIMTAAGFVVGIIHRLIPDAAPVDVFRGLAEGEIDTKPVPGGVLVSFVSLIGGFSLGPEVPTGMLAGGLASEIAKRRDWDETTRKLTFGSAMAGAYGGLFTSPFVAIMLILELVPLRRIEYVSLLGIQVVGALTGFAVFFAVGGYAGLLRELSLPDYNLELWHFAVAGGIGALGAAVGSISGFLGPAFQRLAAPLSKRVVLRGVIAGAALGLLAMAVPATLFSGATALPDVASQAISIGIATLVISAIAKIVAMHAAQAFGFIGGPIFPLVFAGAAIGAAVHGVFPDVPLALAVPAGMAAVPAAVLPLPLSLGILAIVIAGTSLELGAPVLTASVMATLLVQGLRRKPPAKKLEADPIT